MHTNSCSSYHHARAKSILFGFLLVVAGLLFLSFNFGWIAPALKPVIFSWPVIFIVIGIIGFSKSNYFFSLILLLLGGFFLLPRIAAAYPDSFRGIDTDFTQTFWPLLLIILGIGFIFKVTFIRNRSKDRWAYRIHEKETTEKSEDANARKTTRPTDNLEGDGRIYKKVFFSGSESIFLEPVLYGGDLEAIFGGIVLDLRKAQLPEGVTYLDIEAIFGGVELYIPSDWYVESKLQTMFGGFHDQRLMLPSDKSRKLVLQGDLVFGGCNIR